MRITALFAAVALLAVSAQAQAILPNQGGGGENIVSFGADPSGATDSSSAIQAANDTAYATGRLRSIYCPDGIYKTTVPIFFDAPGNMRGADGVNGTAYASGTTYAAGLTANSGGIPYISLQNSNVGNTPATSPTWWQPFNYNSGTTYGLNAVVRYLGIPWISLQASNTGNPPSVTSAFWIPTQITPTIYNGSYVFFGNEGLGQTSNLGCQLHPTFNNTTAFWIGTGSGNVAKNFSIIGSPSAHTGLQNPNGVGLGIAGGNAGANRTIVENLWISNYYTLIQTEYNAGQAGFGAETTFRKVSGANCWNGINIIGGDSFINTAYDPSIACTNDFFTQNNLSIFGGNWSQNSQISNSFSISSVSSLTATLEPNFDYYQYSFTATISSPDQYITGCGTNVPPSFTNSSGNCVYNAWTLSTPHFGIIPLTMTAWNSATGVATFQTLEAWGYFFGQAQNALSATGLQTDVQAAATIYAAELSTLFSAGVTLSATGGWIENDGQCSTVAVGGNITLTSVRWNDDPSLGHGTAAGTAMLYCQQAFPLFYNSLSGGIRLTGSVLDQNGNNEASVNIDVANATNDFTGIISENNSNGAGLPFFFNPVIRQLGSKQSGPTTGVFDRSPYISAAQASTTNGGPYRGWFPAQWSHPRVPSSLYTEWQSIAGNTIGSYLNANGGTFYSVLDPIGANAGKIVQSAHQFDSYGQGLTTSNVPTISLSWEGQSPVVLADVGTLALMYPGLGILLNNGSGDVRYIVNGVYPYVSLDGGTHAGYFTVFDAAQIGSPYLLSGSNSTMYTATQIDQDSYNFSALTIP